MTLKEFWIVDDDPIARILIQKKMQRQNLGQNFKMFNNGQEAWDGLLEIETANKPELILLDLNMPILDGWGFLDLAREKIQDYGIKVVILSSSISESDHRKAEEYPCVSAFLNKPLRIEKLISILDLKPHKSWITP